METQAEDTQAAEAPAAKAPVPPAQFKGDERPENWQPYHEEEYQEFVNTICGGVEPHDSHERDKIFFDIMANHPPPTARPPT